MRRALASAALALAASATAACACTSAAPGPAESPEGPVVMASPQAPAAAAPSAAMQHYPPSAEPAASAPVPVAPVPAAERELLEAYGRYWELYAGALLALDGSRLSEVMTGPRLERAQEEIARLELTGHAVRVDVESAPIVGMLRGGEAVIIDRYRNQSYVVDAQGRPVSARGVANIVHVTVSLVREEGAWKVRESRRERAP